MPDDRASRIKVLAERMALSPAFRAYFGSHDAPEVWEQLVRTLSDAAMDDFTLILNEEDSMRKDNAVNAARRHAANETHLKQQLEQMRMKAHASDTSSHD